MRSKDYLVGLACLGLAAWIACTPDSDPLTFNYFDHEYPVVAVADDSELPDSLRRAYLEDAGILTLRIVEDVGGEASDQVELPNELLNALYSALIHVYRATDLAARDTVVDMFDIHVMHTWAIRSLIVAVDSTKAWTEAWRNGERLTGNEQIDQLMETYDLELDEYYDFPWGPLVTLKSIRPLNMAALARRFAAINGVRYSEPNGGAGDGSNITARTEGTCWRLEYSLGWGDCPAGCIARRFWAFEVDHKGRVAFAGSRGSPLPDIHTPGWED